ncbi:gliding motility-associated C-terminal domain-containing protein, partial [Flavobacterium sp. CYK-55]|uniref:gliding motility-associated C-terminal domain-containing protein n=1 Tax=Flavobacterium sp. CYK-55 TaxID=2835529 RepID=UPI001BCFDA4D
TQPTCAVATGSVELTGLPTGTWTINPGNISGTGTSTTVSGLATGSYNFTVTNSEGCTSSASAEVVINAQPQTPSAPVAGTVTQPTCAVATGSVELTGLPTGTWTINPGNISGTGTSTTVSGLAAGSYNFTVTNSEGCTSSASAEVVINAQPQTPSEPISGGNQTGCFSNPITALTATATTGAGNTIVWFNAPVDGFTVDNPTLNTVGTITYYAASFNGTCYSATRTAVTLTINPAPTAPSLSNIVAECSATAPAPTMNDNCGNTLIGITTDPTIYNTIGNYVIHWTFNNANGQFVVSANQNVVVQDTQAPIAPVLPNITAQCTVTVTPPTGQDTCAGQVTATTSDPLTYQGEGTYTIHWVFSDGINSTTAIQQVIIDDTVDPLIPTLATLTGTCLVNVPAPTTTDTCNQNTITGTTLDPVSYNVAGTYTVNWSFNDGNGNIATTTQTVIVNPGTAPDNITAYAECNNDNSPERLINLDTLLPTGVPSGGTWTDVDFSNGVTGNIFNPYDVPVGNYLITYAVAEGDCSRLVNLVITVDDECEVDPECSEPVVYNAVSPNNDGVNEYLNIDNLDQFTCFPTNSVEIYNRWGVLVYETSQYDNAARSFKGTSEGRVTVDKSAQLPTGTYFYILNYTDKNGSNHHKEGYLYLTR